MGIDGKMVPSKETEAGGATNAIRPPNDSLEWTKEPLMGKLYPIDPAVNTAPPQFPNVMSRPYVVDCAAIEGDLVVVSEWHQTALRVTLDSCSGSCDLILHAENVDAWAALFARAVVLIREASE